MYVRCVLACLCVALHQLVCCVMVACVMLCYLILSYVVLSHLMLYYVVLSYVILCYLTDRHPEKAEVGHANGELCRVVRPGQVHLRPVPLDDAGLQNVVGKGLPGTRRIDWIHLVYDGKGGASTEKRQDKTRPIRYCKIL